MSYLHYNSSSKGTLKAPACLLKSQMPTDFGFLYYNFQTIQFYVSKHISPKGLLAKATCTFLELIMYEGLSKPVLKTRVAKATWMLDEVCKNWWRIDRRQAPSHLHQHHNLHLSS